MAYDCVPGPPPMPGSIVLLADARGQMPLKPAPLPGRCWSCGTPFPRYWGQCPSCGERRTPRIETPTEGREETR